MDIRIYFKNMTHSDVMEKYAHDQLAKIIEFLKNERTPVYVYLTFEPSKTREHNRVELLVKTPNYDLVSEYHHPGVEFYEVIDRVIDTMYRQLLEAKKKRIDERNHGKPETWVKKF
jgi:ribosomal subunit interface protein